jgi:hypothetical protein
VSIIDSERGRLGTAVAKYPLHRKREDPDYATHCFVLGTRCAGPCALGDILPEVRRIASQVNVSTQ